MRQRRRCVLSDACVGGNGERTVRACPGIGDRLKSIGDGSKNLGNGLKSIGDGLKSIDDGLRIRIACHAWLEHVDSSIPRST